MAYPLGYIIPRTKPNPLGYGDPPADLPTINDRAYWRIRCPACGEIHERSVQLDYIDEPETVLTDNPHGAVQVYHRFICPKRRLHFKMQAEWPWEIEKEISYASTIQKDNEGWRYFVEQSAQTDEKGD